ncbi:transglycosylase SLT domain-containing protein [Actinobacillus pleuropneumoniae]|uniref:Lytic murein transglycosylase n=1 Tax=Actinobacillus pleuropneumoniae TaxID=715 RepID=A0ABN5MJY7_ACTPL|nr:transglycosylase SLT domain-containing protein [Actinobacillus pleuropneumoniae]ASU16649.1 Soluble lytic murein transglycosylase [Actinobacillus pleuropneumoniae]AWG95090.1 lytic murein transglycosylase [Actinobacillus pleuropneumoniae serovar 1 str. 4074]AXA21162.1 lytic murein transglycosylase [Actinobacillus pleuropneumoniae]EFM94499.1 soluble lytic murein transglycosylase [Actinobacillus pleuropneumoniae serovar 9 str. CVJ13261]EFM98830.1 soluble lytic murein transglycosylase [Actinobac
MIWKKTLLTLLVLSSSVWAAEKKSHAQKTFSESEVTALKAEWLAEQKTQWLQQAGQREKQREAFLIADNLLKTAISSKQFSAETQRLVNALIRSLDTYPLKRDIDWAVLKAKIESKQVTADDIRAFSALYPNSPYQKQFEQLPFAQLYERKKWADLLKYSEKVTPVGMDNQCRVLASQFQLLSEKLQSESPQAQTESNRFLIADLLAQFEKLWLKTTALPSECTELESYWKAKSGITAEKIRLKAVHLFDKNAKSELSNLLPIAENQTPELKNWLVTVEQLAKQPTTLPAFIEQATADEQSRMIANKAFPQFMRTIAENTGNPDFTPYQTWADKLGLSAEEQKAWKVTFLNRLFDNENGNFQIWRDQQIQQLQADNLTERRIRLAILQQAPLADWLSLLSNEAKSKPEWRYWAAKNEKEAKKREASLIALSKERGFYPMLAAQLLGKQYVPTQGLLLKSDVQSRLQPQFDRIKELRDLQRFAQAKTAWIELLDELSVDDKLAVTDYAKQQNWYDLAVEGTIQAKAFDYLSLRLPNAYSDWFDLNLEGKPISKTFAMAIARQESAWNFQARSHANALGLMQMLPSTAQKTAQDNQLPYRNEQDLLQPFNNIMLGTTHLAELNAKYSNNRFLIAAAYNAGASRVERWLARANGKLALDEFVASIPFYETRGYVQNVVAYDYYQQLLQKVEKPIMFYKDEWQRKY